MYFSCVEQQLYVVLEISCTMHVPFVREAADRDRSRWAARFRQGKADVQPMACGNARHGFCHQYHKKPSFFFYSVCALVVRRISV